MNGALTADPLLWQGRWRWLIVCVCQSFVTWEEGRLVALTEEQRLTQNTHPPTQTFLLRQYSYIDIEQFFILCFFFCIISMSISVATVQSKDATFTQHLLSNSMWGLNPLRSLLWNETRWRGSRHNTRALSIVGTPVCWLLVFITLPLHVLCLLHQY